MPSAHLHQLRHLLRECTYLPDVNAREWTKSYILKRYRRYVPKLRPLPGRSKGARRPGERTAWDSLPPERQKNLTRSARIALGLLRRANAGELGPLTKVLMYAYGRRGPRRRDLIEEFLRQPDPAIDPNMYRPLGGKDASPMEPRVHRCIVWGRNGPQALAGKLDTLVKSQQLVGDLLLDRTPLKHTAPVIPEKNSWGRPFPVKRERNLRKKWKAMVLDRVVAPLPEAEWKFLQHLIESGGVWKPKPRRKMIQEPLEPTNPLSVEDALLGSPRKLSSFRGRGTNPHHITARYMRRIWGKIWAQCPMMTWDKESSRWLIQWGKRYLMNRERYVQPLHEEVASLLFEGVDEKGKILSGHGQPHLRHIPRRFDKRWGRDQRLREPGSDHSPGVS